MAAPDEVQALLTLQRELIVELRAQLTLLHGQNAELRAELHAARNERAMRAAHADENGQTPFLPSLDELEQMAQDQGNVKLSALLKNLSGGTDS